MSASKLLVFKNSMLLMQFSKKTPLALTLFLCLISGACSLGYQILWFETVSLLVGGSSVSAAVVSTFYFLGIMLGARIAAQVCVKVRKPLRVFAYIELGIGLCALGIPSLLPIFEKMVTHLPPALASSLAPWLVGSLLLLPCCLMGMTLPMLLVALGSLDAHKVDLAPIYSLNTLGAALGVLLTAFLLLPSFGYAKSILVLGFLQTSLALALLWMGWRHVKTPVYHVYAPVTSKTASSFWPLASLVVGMACLGMEVLWGRFLLLFFRDSSILWAYILFAFILGTAAGAFVFQSKKKSLENIATRCLLLACASTLSCLAGLWALESSSLAHTVLFFEGLPMLAWVLCLALPPAFFLGGLFPHMAQAFCLESGCGLAQATGKTLAFNTLGCSLGAIGTAFVLIPAVGLLHSFAFLALLLSLLALSLAWRHGLTWQKIPAALFCLALPVPFFFLGPMEKLITLPYPEMHLLELIQGRDTTVWAASLPHGERILVENKVIISRDMNGAFISQGLLPFFALTAQVSSLEEAAQPKKRLLGLCFGGGLSYALPRLAPNIQSMDFVDISQENVQLALRVFPVNQALAQDPRARFHVADAYTWLAHTQSRYDLILVEPTPPAFGFRAARLYSQQFYQRMLKVLAPQGMVTQVLPIAQLSLEECRNIMASFTAVFPHCSLWWNGLDFIMAGGHESPRFSVTSLRQLYHEPGYAPLLKQSTTWGLLDSAENFMASCLMDTGSFKAFAQQGIIYTVDNPALRYSKWDENGTQAQEILLSMRPYLMPSQGFLAFFSLLKPASADVLVNTRNFLLSRSFKESSK